MTTIKEAAGVLPITQSCSALGVSRTTYYRWQRDDEGKRTRAEEPAHPVAESDPETAAESVTETVPATMPKDAESVHPRALSLAEREEVRDLLNSKRFMDMAPAQVYATLLDEGRYLCSIRTMYRILAANGEVRERRNQLRHPSYAVPELLATSPNEVWSWDITRLRGPVKWSYYQLYVILDIYSRYVVGWMVAGRESAELARRLIKKTAERQGVEETQLTLHADRGSSMRSKAVALLLSDLGITKTHSRPHVSNDNPFSEAQFKTLKYRPNFPDRFSSIEEARAFCQNFFAWYNEQHRHSGIGLLTPYDVHYGLAGRKTRERARVLMAAYEANPERFPRGLPQPPEVPAAVWINKPVETPVEIPTEADESEPALH